MKHDSALFGEAFLSDVIDNKNVWIAVTGASYHMIKTKEYYSCYRTFDEPKPITLENKQLMLTYGQGDIQVEALVGGKRQ